MRKTRMTLLSSAIVLAVSFALLLSATFAWFTDGVTNSGNKIESGELSVKLYQLQDGRYVDTESPEYSGPAFDYDLWEPGYAAVEAFRVENAGTLALKYRIDVFATEKTGTDGADIAEVIDVYYAALDTEAVTLPGLAEMERVGTLAEVLANSEAAAAGQLDRAGDADYAAVALKMQESAGNEYMNASVKFDVTVKAAQAASEEDGFGSSDYDKEAEFGAAWDGVTKLPLTETDGTYNITEAGQFASLQDLSSAQISGKTFVLQANVDLGGNQWKPMANANGFTVEGNGHTVKNFTMTESAENGVGMFGSKGVQNATIRNITVENVKVEALAGESSNYVAVIAGNLQNCTVENITVRDAEVTGGRWVGGITGYLQNSNIKDVLAERVTVNSQSVKGKAGAVAGAWQVIAGTPLTAENIRAVGCSVSVIEANEKDEKGAMFGCLDARDTATMIDCSATGCAPVKLVGFVYTAAGYPAEPTLHLKGCTTDGGVTGISGGTQGTNWIIVE